MGEWGQRMRGRWGIMEGCKGRREEWRGEMKEKQGGEKGR